MKTQIQRLDAARSGAATASAVDYATFPNAMPASREAAPRLGRAYAAGSAGQKEVYECMKEHGYQMGEAEAVRIWNALGFIIKDKMPRDGRAYDVGFARFFPAIKGTFESADADFDPERNRLYVAAAPSDEIRSALSDGTPTRIDGDAAKDARINNVTWGDGSDKNTIKSGVPFSIHGSGLTIGVGDEHAVLTLPTGGTVEVALSEPADEKGIGQRLVGMLATDVESCEGASLTLYTHGFDTKSTIRPVKSAKLTVLAGEGPVVPAPTITGAKTRGESEGSVNIAGGILDVVGANLETATAVELHSDVQPTGEASLWQTMPATYADGKLTTGELDFDEKPSDGGFVRVATAGGSALYPITYCAH